MLLSICPSDVNILFNALELALQRDLTIFRRFLSSFWDGMVFKFLMFECVKFNSHFLTQSIQTPCDNVGCICSCIGLAQKSIMPPFRMHLRAHGTVAKMFGHLQDAITDPVSINSFIPYFICV